MNAPTATRFAGSMIALVLMLPQVTAAAGNPSLDELRAKAESGDVAAELAVGLKYSKGDGVAQDANEAAKWLLMAAGKGSGDAEFALGAMLFNGKNSVEAAKWLRRAADHGNLVAPFDLGMMYQSGDGVPKDSAESAKWMRIAAERGHLNAQNILGMKYAMGDGVPKDAGGGTRHTCSRCDDASL